MQSAFPGSNVQLPAVDTIRIVERYVSQDEYIRLLENVNEQLAFRWGPYNTAIALLGVLFAVGAIAVAVLLYTQSRDFKETLDRTIASNRDLVQKVVAKAQEDVQLYMARANELIDERIADARTQLETAQGAEAEALKERIKRLEAERPSAKVRGLLHVDPLTDPYSGSTIPVLNITQDPWYSWSHLPSDLTSDRSTSVPRIVPERGSDPGTEG